MKDCPFCLENNLLKGEVIYKDELWYFTGPDPEDDSNAGMAITRRHVGTPFEINEHEWTALHKLLPEFKQVLDDHELPQGYNIGWNVGPTGGQTIPHAHLHIAARYDDEAMANMGIRYHFKSFRNQRSSRV